MDEYARLVFAPEEIDEVGALRGTELMMGARFGVIFSVWHRHGSVHESDVLRHVPRFRRVLGRLNGAALLRSRARKRVVLKRHGEGVRAGGGRVRGRDHRIGFVRGANKT